MQPSANSEEFSEVLGRILAENRTSVRRLEHISGVSRRTVENWLHGSVRRPRYWEPVLRVAHALHLSAAETDTLLHTAGLPSLSALRASPLTHGQSDLLTIWYSTQRKESAAAPPNLPVASSWFIGRESMLEKLAALLLRPDVRLVTVTGPGGIGKTRLAQEVAQRVAGDFDHGVTFVPLESAATAGDIAERLLDALGLQRRSAVPPAETVLNYLRNKRLLLILDTVEHLLPELGLIGRLRREAPGVKLMATSRSLLRLSGEHVFIVPPLDVSSASAHPDANAYPDAVTLFVTRVREVIPDFALTADNAADANQVCRLLDGLPLAIELAAAQSRVLSLRQIRARLESGTELLAGGPRDAPSRHQSIEQTLDWSYNLLPPAEQMLFRCLGVFRQGSSLAAAMAVAPPEWREGDQTIDVLFGLVDNSLLQIFRLNNRRIYRMHAITRHFAAERLAAAGETDLVMGRLLDFMLETATHLNDNFRTPQRNSLVEEFEPESDHVWAVLEWGLQSNDIAAIERCLSLTGVMLQYWNVRGHHEPARRWTNLTLDAARRHNIPLAAQATALITGSAMALILADIDDSKTHAAEALAAARAGNDRRLAIRALHLLGLCAYARAELDTAGEIWEEALQLAEQENAPSLLAAALDDLGNLAARRGELDRALAIHRREQAVSLAAGDLYSEFYAVINLGEVSLNKGRPEDAELYYRRALELCRTLDDSRGLAHTMLTQAALMLRLGRSDEALGLMRESARLAWNINNLDIVLSALEMVLVNDDSLRVATRARLGGALTELSKKYASASLPANREALETARAKLAEMMNAGHLEQEWQIGQTLSWDQAVAMAVESPA